MRHDDDGKDFESLDVAYQTACREIPEMVAEFLRQRTDPMDFSFEITNEDGIILIDIPFRETVHRSAARLDLRRADVSALVSSRLVWKRTRFLGPDSLNAFMDFPIPCVFLTAGFRIAAINESFRTSGVEKGPRIIGRSFFDLFPDRAENDNFAGRRRLETELARLIDNPRPKSWRCQRYDVRGSDGLWVERYWDVSNWPIFGEGGTLAGIAHSGTAVEPPSKPPQDEKSDRLGADQKVSEG